MAYLHCHTPEAKVNDIDNYCVICPVCKNASCEPGEYVEYDKVSPDRCWICGWQESNGTEAYPDNTDYVEKCWQLQVAPYKELEL